MEITPALLDLFLGFFEVDGLGPGPVSGPFPGPADHAGEVVPEEYQVVEQRHNGDEGHQRLSGEQAPQDFKGKQGCVQPGKPLDFYRDNKVYHKLGVRVEGSEGEEQGHVDIIHVRTQYTKGLSSGEVDGEAHQDVQRNTQSVKEGEPGGAPLAFQGGSEEIVEHQGKDEPNGVAVDGDEDEGEQPPDFPP